MAKHPRVTLMVRRKIGRNWKHVPVKSSGNNRLRRLSGDGMYSLRYRVAGRDTWEPVGQDLDAALAAKRRQEITLEKVPGVSVAETSSPGSQIESRVINAAIDQYLADTRLQKEPKTLKAYQISVTQFRQSCAKTYLEELERRDLLNFVAFLRNCRKKNGELLSNRTVYNRFENVITFLKEYGIRGLALKKDWPTYEEEDAAPFSDDELVSLFAAANQEEFARYQFFLKSGARDQEVVFATWLDVDLESKVLHIRAKSDLGFKPKNHEARTIPIPDDLVDILLKRHEETSNARLLFITQEGNPDRKFLRKLKVLACRAGLNCGHCTAMTKGKMVSC